MSELATANKQVASDFLRAIEAGDMPALEPLLAPAFQWWVSGWGKRSRIEFLNALSRTIGAFPSRRLTPGGFTAEGERVAVEAEGRFERPGLLYCNTYHYLFIVRDGLITSGREYFDTSAARAAFGPPPQQGDHHEQK